MLGKTNITTLAEGAVATEIEDYNWIQMQAGINGNFVKAVYKNGYLVAITGDGKIVYTIDGEVWNTSVPQAGACKINDVDWDGNRFILVGKYMDTSDETGLIMATANFETYEVMEIKNANKEDVLAVYPENGMYSIVTVGQNDYIRLLTTDLGTTWKWEQIESNYTKDTISVAKNSSEMLVCFHTGYYNSGYFDRVYKIKEGVVSAIKSVNNSAELRLIFALECKDTLYYCSHKSVDNYSFTKVLSSGECIDMSTDINYMFVDSIYFNECQIFINNHNMLIVKKGENIADKKLDDMVEIAPEFTINCITKAFGQLYVFGNKGVILKSSVETNNENAIVVQTLSAKKALAEARIYTDEKYAALEARIAALEAANVTE